LIESNILELDNRLDTFFSVGNIFLKNILILKNNFVNDISCFLLKSNNNISIFLRKNVFNIVFFLKNSSYFSFSQLLDFTVIDRLEMSIKKDKRFEFFYLFVSTIFSYRIFLRGFISSFESIKSLSVLYYSSIWLEREVWDMFGIFIVEHPDLRRILTDYGFLGHPFRKDFPLTGYVELRYDETNKYIIAEPLELSQEFRFFKFDNPWKK
jgi:NADH-quinone oxidoreductase subunit C